jgi:hypothetical protein
MDRKAVPLPGFAKMAANFAAIALIPGIEKPVLPCLIIYGVSYFFTEFGSNATTFVCPAAAAASLLASASRRGCRPIPRAKASGS